MNARLRVALLFAPVLLQLCLFRLTEFSLSRFTDSLGFMDVPVARTLAADAPIFLLAVLTPFALYTFGRRFSSDDQPIWAVSLGALGALGLLALAPLTGSRWLRPEAIEFVWLDALMITSLAALLFLGIRSTRGLIRIVLIVLAHVSAGILSLLLSLNFGYYLKTGTSGDWLLFWYAMGTFHETQDIIASEITSADVLLLSLPALIALTPAILDPVVRRIRPSSSEIRRSPKYAWIVAGCLFAVMAVRSAQLDAVRPANVSFFAGFVRETVSVRESVPRDFRDETPAFDAASLRLRATADARRLNVVMIVLESVRADVLTPYNSDLTTSPFLDSLARSGVLVENMYAPVAHTTKAMTPILAGIYPTLQLSFPESEPGGLPARALPTLLADHGYRSAFFTPAPLEFENKEGLLRNMGFDVLRGSGSFDTSGFERIGYFGYEDHVILQPAMEWVDAAVRDSAPFLLSVLTLTTHHPYKPPARFADASWNRRLPDNYLNTIVATDAFLRDLFYEFDRRGLLHETLFVIVSDHGEAFREHGMTGHNQVLWDEVLHVPCVLFAPSLFDGPIRVVGPRSQVDLLPTIAAALGFEIEGGRLSGRSLLDEADSGRLMFHSAWNPRQGLAYRDADKKYMYFYDREPLKAFLYSSDPQERFDIVEELSRPEIEEIAASLVGWRWSVAAAYRNATRRQSPVTAALTPISN